MIRYGSVCSGIEAASKAWEGLGWEAAFFSEIEPFPSAVLAHHYGSNMPGEPLSKNGIPNYGDFTTIPADAGPVDLLVGGTPCQSFSVAGRRLGLDDPRGNLALEYLALARRLRARWFVWENVPGVLSSRSGDESAEEGEEDAGGGLESADFATFLSFVRECGYGFAYRVLDAQYVRVDGYARAVPQRRRRIFVVGYLGDWRRAAAVLLEPEGMRGDFAPRREAGQGVAGAVMASAGRRGGTDDPERGKLIAEAFGGGNTSGSIDVSTALTAHGQRQDFEVETFIAEIAATLNAGGNMTGGNRQPGTTADTATTMLVAHTLRADGFDASEDGTGRGTPIVPIAFDSKASGRNGFAVGEISPTLRAMGKKNSNQNAGGQVAVAEPYTLAIRGRADGHQLEYRQDGTANAVLTANGGRAGIGVGAIAHAIQAGAMRENADSGPDGVGLQENVAYTLEARQEVQAVHQAWAVRRLTPRECERLQGFPDDYTDIPWNKKPHAPDGPRYKALGNSMAVNVMRWIGMRIDLMEKLIASGKIGP